MGKRAGVIPNSAKYIAGYYGGESTLVEISYEAIIKAADRIYNILWEDFIKKRDTGNEIRISKHTGTKKLAQEVNKQKA